MVGGGLDFENGRGRGDMYDGVGVDGVEGDLEGVRHFREETTFSGTAWRMGRKVEMVMTRRRRRA